MLRDPGWTKTRIWDPGSGINIPDPQHWLQVSAYESLKAISSCNCCRNNFWNKEKKTNKKIPRLLLWERDQPQNHRPSAKKLRTNPEPNRGRQAGNFLVIIYKKAKQVPEPRRPRRTFKKSSAYLHNFRRGVGAKYPYTADTTLHGEKVFLKLERL